jgi:hypothetical protein
MERANFPNESKGFRPPLLIEFLATAVPAIVVSKYVIAKGALISSPKVMYFTVIGLVDTLLGN